MTDKINIDKNGGISTTTATYDDKASAIFWGASLTGSVELSKDDSKSLRNKIKKSRRKRNR